MTASRFTPARTLQALVLAGALAFGASACGVSTDDAPHDIDMPASSTTQPRTSTPPGTGSVAP
ncbi:MAG: hypothetical protein WCO88_03045 [Actinomycetota bacterium]